MGRHLGHLRHLRRFVFFSLSPFEQRAYAGAVTNGLPKLMTRFSQKVFLSAPWFVALYLVYDWGNAEYLNSFRKKPGQYDNDE